MDDLDPITPADRAEQLQHELVSAWQQQLLVSGWLDDDAPAAAGGRRKRTMPSLFWALWAVFGVRYMRFGIALIFYLCSQIAQALLLRAIVQFIGDSGTPDAQPDWQGYVFAVSLGLASLAQATVHHQYFFHTHRTGKQVHVALTGLIFDKSLSLKTAAFLSTTTGQVW